MRFVIIGAKEAPYDMTDDKTGERKSGRSGAIHGFKPRQASGDAWVGMEMTERKCEPAFAAEVKKQLGSANEPLVYDIDLDTKGRGDFENIIVVDGELVGKLSDFHLGITGLTPRIAAQAVPQRVAGANGPASPREAAPARA